MVAGTIAQALAQQVELRLALFAHRIGQQFDALGWAGMDCSHRRFNTARGAQKPPRARPGPRIRPY